LWPKAAFLADTGRAEAHRARVSDPEVARVLRECIAEMAYSGYSREQMDGAAALARVFLDFAEPASEVRRIPVKQLTIQ
jgi:hypothetical protein